MAPVFAGDMRFGSGDSGHNVGVAVLLFQNG